MEKKLYTLKIDPELHDLIPPLTEDEHRMLEDSIMRDGCDTPLTVWNGTIVDGHNRYNICRAHGIPFAIEERDFICKDTAIAWALERQLARRNLTNFQRAEMALRFETLFRQQAKLHQGHRSDLNKQLTASSELPTKCWTRDRLASIAGVSGNTIHRARVINKLGDEETKQQLRRGEISMNKAYTKVMGTSLESENQNHDSSETPTGNQIASRLIELMDHAANEYLETLESILAQCGSELDSKEFTAIVRQVIDGVAGSSTLILKKHLKSLNNK